MKTPSLEALEKFIVRAKKATYMGRAKKLLPYRLGSKDLQFIDEDWAYQDSYFGKSDFIGQEIVYYTQKPVWGMNYFGYILQPEKITLSEKTQMIIKSLSSMYAEERFLGGFEHIVDHFKYVDTNTGNVARFYGKEQVYYEDELVYELVYHGGLIRS